LARRFTLAAIFLLGVVTWIDILDIAGEFSGVVVEVAHPTITKTPAKENWHQLEPQ
jgi:hypothetical protein